MVKFFVIFLITLDPSLLRPPTADAPTLAPCWRVHHGRAAVHPPATATACLLQQQHEHRWLRHHHEPAAADQGHQQQGGHHPPAAAAGVHRWRPAATTAATAAGSDSWWGWCYRHPTAATVDGLAAAAAPGPGDPATAADHRESCSSSLPVWTVATLPWPGYC